MGKGAQNLVWREAHGRSVLVPSEVIQKRSGELPVVTLEEVAKHNKMDDMWFVIHDKVYDLSRWAKYHPGDVMPLLNLAGKDATDAFTQYHPAWVWDKKLPHFTVARLAHNPHDDDPFVRDQRALHQHLLEAGLYKTSAMYYVKKVVWLSSLLGASLALTLLCESFWLHMLGALVLGMFWQQLAFVGHDTGHNALTHHQWVDYAIGVFVGNFLGGVSIGWWKRSHNVHHVVCNSVEHDPDIQHLPLLAVTNKIFDGPFFSSYHRKWFSVDGVARFMVCYQHLMYYPVMCLARFNLYLQSLLLLFSRNNGVLCAPLEVVAMGGFMVWMSLLTMQLPSAWERLAFVLVSHAVTGLLHVQITLSHFAMETYHDRTYTSAKDGWARTQLATSMGIECPEWMDWFHGGLQFQVEHHLLPRLPRHNLRYAKQLVMSLCRKHNVPYHSMSFWEANKFVLAHMKKRAEEVQQLKRAPEGFYSTMIYESMALKG